MLPLFVLASDSYFFFDASNASAKPDDNKPKPLAEPAIEQGAVIFYLDGSREHLLYQTDDQAARPAPSPVSLMRRKTE